MKIATKAADGFIRAPGACKAVLLYGPDDGLVRDRYQLLRDGFLGKDYDAMALVEFDEASLSQDGAKLSDEILAVSMMAPRRMIVLRVTGDKVASLIKEAAPHLHDDVRLVVLAGELTTRSSLRSWFEADAQAASVACYQDEGYQLQGVIRKSFSEAGIQASADATDYLAAQLGNDRYVTYQELQKIITYLGEQKQLTIEVAQALVGYNKDSDLDDIVQAVADKNLANLDKMLQVQLHEGAQPIAYLRALQRYFNRLYLLKAQMSQGVSMESAISGLKPKVFFKQEQSLKRHLTQWKLTDVTKALGFLIAAELACKTSDLPPIPASSRKLFQIAQIR
ncbi:MAG: DNA polymerase III subunit delta [Rickettsiales bacterium]|nr:DNA polymerase III subunit delta [Rickettsiales bacterium]